MRLLLDFGGTDLKMALCDDGGIDATASVPAKMLSGDLDSATSVIKDAFGSLDSIEAVGISLPGVVNHGTGELLHANAKYDFAQNIDLREWGQKRFGAPTIVENDARAALVGEVDALRHAGGSQFEIADAVLLTLGTGIGTAALQGGLAVRGATGHAGILGGHVTVDIDGRLCPCGNRGCPETLASTWALQEQGGYPGGFREVFAAAASGEAEALRIVERSAEVWGAVAVTLCHQYDPQVLFLTGGVMRGGEMVSEAIQEYLRTHLWPSIETPKVVLPDSPELSVVKGLDVILRESVLN